MYFKEYDFSDLIITNHDFYLKPRGIYRLKKIICDNYLYPVYFTEINKITYYSTSVCSLIFKRKVFERNANFQTTDFFRPTFQTIDKNVYRVRTIDRTSSKTLNDPNVIISKSAIIFQNYISEIENKFKDYKHLLLMGGKDSQNYLLANRSAKWIVLSGEPNAILNKKFIEENKIKNVEEFITLKDEPDNELLLEEILSSDCFFDIGHFKYIPKIHEIIRKYQEKVIVWYGAGGDGKFIYCSNHKFENYYQEAHVLHVGMSMGILHQLTKNLSNVPVLSIYQSPEFLDEVFYKFDPYYTKKLKSDIRIDIGKQLFNGKLPIYPNENPHPRDWTDKIRDRNKSIDKYVNYLSGKNIKVNKNLIKSVFIKYIELVIFNLNKHSSKKRSFLSKLLFVIRNNLSKILPFFKIRRYYIKEI